MATCDLDEIELAAIDEMMKGQLSEIDARKFISSLEVTSRDIGGSGFISELHSRENAIFSRRSAINPLTTLGRHKSLSSGAIFSLWFNRDGSIDYLEGATLGGEPWPLDPRGFAFE